MNCESMPWPNVFLGCFMMVGVCVLVYLFLKYSGKYESIGDIYHIPKNPANVEWKYEIKETREPKEK